MTTTYAAYTRSQDLAWRNAKPGARKVILVHIYRNSVRVAFDDPSCDRPIAVGLVTTRMQCVSSGFACELLINGKRVTATGAARAELSTAIVSNRPDGWPEAKWRQTDVVLLASTADGRDITLDFKALS